MDSLGEPKYCGVHSCLGDGAYTRFHAVNQKITVPNGTVAKSLLNGLVGTGFAHLYRLQPRTC